MPTRRAPVVLVATVRGVEFDSRPAMAYEWIERAARASGPHPDATGLGVHPPRG